ncbi:hypothetical protein [Blastococcus deserti]|uniref:Uncharacterized protein n=1 Tax=Blastococcus deserti TaxID=2259033 RepID=A0ABW4XH29_9ACTN
MANGGTGILTGSTESMAPEVARRTWPRLVGLGVLMVVVAVAALLWEAAGARLLLGALGLFLVVRGGTLLRGVRSGTADAELAGRARVLGTAALGWGAAGLVAALVSEAVAGTVLLIAVPVALLAAGVALTGRGGAARRGGQGLVLWALLMTGLLVATVLGQSWERAADVATVVSALALAVLAVPVLVGAVGVRAVAVRPAPTVRAGCAGCACGAGGCGA